jgi:hypothetical protein
MKTIFSTLAMIALVALTGCANLNPRNNPKIENQNGQIDEIKSNQNGVMAEIGKLKQTAEIQGSQLREIQNGLVNINAALSRNENSGVQIFQGDGSLILIFALGVIGMVLYWYRDQAIRHEKTAEIMAREIARINNPDLNDSVILAAMHTESEQDIIHLLTDQRRKLLG